MAEFMTGTDVALVLLVSPATVRAMAERGELRVAARTESGIRLFQREEVLRVAQKRKEASDE